jgi:hypothetical protein
MQFICIKIIYWNFIKIINAIIIYLHVVDHKPHDPQIFSLIITHHMDASISPNLLIHEVFIFFIIFNCWWTYMCLNITWQWGYTWCNQEAHQNSCLEHYLLGHVGTRSGYATRWHLGIVHLHWHSLQLLCACNLTYLITKILVACIICN